MLNYIGRACNNFVSISTGIQTSQDARFYGLSAKFDKFSNEDKDLVIQFTVKHEQNIDCGGGYVKVFSSDLDQTDMHGDSPYNIMFGMYMNLFLCFEVISADILSITNYYAILKS